MSDEKFATELLKEVKAQSKRNFILFVMMVVLEALTILWFTFPVFEDNGNEIAISSEEGSANYLEDSEIGGRFSQCPR